MKVTIEHAGVRLELGEDQLQNVELSLPSEIAEVPCPCTPPCGYVHRQHAGKWSIALMADLTSQPLWKPVD